jgi:hypothetical protein
MIRASSSRARGRHVAPLEVAIAFALVGSLLAIAVPTFVREIHASRLVEPVDGLHRLAASAVEYGMSHGPAAGRAPGQVFPASAPMTPAVPPRGRCQADPPGAWDHPTWTALEFRPVPEGTPHCFAFAFDSGGAAGQATFRAHAHADLDGDGVESTFEVTGRSLEGDPRGPQIDPGMFVDSENE